MKWKRTAAFLLSAVLAVQMTAAEERKKDTYPRPETGGAVQTVQPDSPVLREVRAVQTGVEMTWDAAPGASGYLIYRSLSGEEAWSRHASVGPETLCYLDTDVKDGVWYRYAVAAERDGAVTGDISNGRQVRAARLTAPKLDSPEVREDGVSLSWSVSPGAELYQIFRKTQDGSWKAAAVTSEPGWVDSDGLDAAYFYTVRAVSQEMTSDFDQQGVTFLHPPELTGIFRSENGVTLCWNRVEGADGYEIYRRTEQSGWISCGLASPEQTSYEDAIDPFAVPARYTAAAFKGDDSSGYDQNGLTIIEPPEINSVKADERNILIHWNGVKDADGYLLYRQDADGWKQIAELPGDANCCTDAGAGQFRNHCYTIRAVKDGARSLPSPVVSLLDSVTLKGIETGENGVTVTWEPSERGECYQILRRGDSTEWTLCAEAGMDAISYLDTEPDFSLWRYTVRTRAGNFTGGCDEQGLEVKWIPALRQPVPEPGGVRVSWEKLEGAEHYTVYSVTENGLEKRAETTETDWLDTDSSEFQTYTVTASFWGQESGAQYPGVTALERPSDIRLEKQPDGLKLCWKAPEGAESYQILRKSDNGDWEVMAETEQPFWMGNVLAEHPEDTYGVRAVRGGRCTGQDGGVCWIKTPSLTGAEVTDSGMIIHWEPVPQADEYRLYRMQEGEWQEITALPGNQTSYPDTDAPKQQNPVYSICAVREGIFSPLYAGWDALGIVKNQRAEASEQGILVRWDGLEHADAYELFRREDNLPWERYAKLPGTTEWYLDTNSKDGHGYCYTVRACFGEYVTCLDEQGTAVPAAVSGASAVLGGSDVRLSWTPAENADKYWIFRLDGQQWKKIAETEEPFYLDSHPEHLSRYLVQAAKDGIGGIRGAELTVSVPAPVLLSLTGEEGGSLLRWTPVEYADRYEVLRMQESGDWETAAETEQTEWHAGWGTADFYTVRAILENGGESAFDPKGLALAEPPGTASCIVTEQGLLIQWPAVQGADGYSLYRREAEEWELLASLEGADSTEYLDTSAEPGKIWLYNVRTVKQNAVSAFQPYSTAAAPGTMLDAVRLENDGIRVYWQNSGAESCCILRREEGADWTELARVTDGSSSYLDTSIRPMTAYWYTVQSWNRQYPGVYDKDGLPALEAPARLSLKPETKGIRLDWKASPGAEAYRIYRRAGADTAWQEIGHTEMPDYLDETGTGDDFYTVRAVRGTLVSGRDEAGKQLFACPGGLTLTLEPEGILFRWEAVPEADGYQVMRAQEDGEWEILTETQELFWLDTTAEYGKYYRYSTAAKFGPLTGYYDTVGVTLIEPPILHPCTVREDGIELSWTPAEHADGYLLYRLSSEWEEIVRLDAGQTSYLDKAPAGRSYRYSIRAVRGPAVSRMQEKSVSAVESMELLGAQAAENGVVLTWNRRAEADGYLILRREPGNPWVLVQETGSDCSSWTDTGADPASGLRYAVCMKIGNYCGFFENEGTPVTAPEEMQS